MSRPWPRASAGDPQRAPSHPSRSVWKPPIPDSAQSAQSGRIPSLTKYPTAAIPPTIAPLSALTPHAHHHRQPLNLALPDPLLPVPTPSASPFPHPASRGHSGASPLHPLYPLSLIPSKTAAYWGLKRDITIVTTIATIAVPPLRRCPPPLSPLLAPIQRLWLAGTGIERAAGAARLCWVR